MKNNQSSDYIKDNYDDYYDPNAADQVEWRWLGAINKAENIISLCSELEVQVEKIVEIGAGDGAILQRLSDLNFGSELSALEISSSGVDAIKRRGLPNLVECKIFDGYETPFSDQQFDLAILSHVVEHVEYPRMLIYEASRIARFVFVEVPLEDTMNLPKDFVFNKVGHINFYSPNSIRRLIQSCGLKVLNQKTTNPSKAVYEFRSGRKGAISFYIKDIYLKTLPRMATNTFTYHESLLCENVT